MASFICHVVCAPKRRRLERLVRPLLPSTRAEHAATQPPEPEHYNNSQTLDRATATDADTSQLYGLAAQVFVPVDSFKAYR